MPVKDYYRILGVEPGTDIASIKKAFRKLAMQHHPDKTDITNENSSYYQELQEAYQTLTDPSMREQYLYNRWLEKSMGHTLDQALTANEILHLFIKAEQYLSITDHYRTNKNLLFHQVLNTFNKQRLSIILETNNQQMMMTTLQLAIQLCSRLDAKLSQELKTHFDELLIKSGSLNKRWDNLIVEKKQKESVEKWKLPFLVLITVGICIIIYFFSK